MNHPTDDPTGVLATLNPPAFPPGMTAFDNMTTRDLFAAFALQGILSGQHAGHAGEQAELAHSSAGVSNTTSPPPATAYPDPAE